MAVCNFAVLFKYEALVALIALSVAAVSAQLIARCTYDSDCEGSVYPLVCCNSECVYFSSCANRSCSPDSNCSIDESCCSSVCVHGSGCIGLPCSSNSDCATGERCCDGECKFDCWGYSCSNASVESDCGDWMTCCYGTCKYAYEQCSKPWSSAQLALLIIGLIIGLIVVWFVIPVCLCRFCRKSADEQSRRRLTRTPFTASREVQNHPPRMERHSNPPHTERRSNPTHTERQSRVEPERRVTITAIVITECTISNNPHHPPPQCEQQQQQQQQVADPAPHNSAAPQGTSERIYAPQSSYGAVLPAHVV